MMKMTEPINRLIKYLVAVEAVQSEWMRPEHEPVPWFRGHSDKSWELEPSLLRRSYVDPEKWEDFFDREFRGRAIAFIQGRAPSTLLEWCYFTRHHGLRTRLLDWSESSLVALYFAVGGIELPNDQDGCVWMLNQTWLLDKAFGDKERDDSERTKMLEGIINRDDDGPLDNHVPVPLRPPYVSPRIAAQHSCFTLHPIKPGAFQRAGASDKELTQMIVPSGCKKQIKKELRQAGITEVVLYPDLDGLARDLEASPLPDRRSYISGIRDLNTSS